jgi:hypothetical protein
MRIDDTRQLARDRGLPAVTGTMVDVLRIGLVPAGPCGATRIAERFRPSRACSTKPTLLYAVPLDGNPCRKYTTG